MLFDKGQETLQLEAKILPLCNRVIDLEEQAEGAKAKMAKIEERVTQQEVQLGRVEGELAQKIELFNKIEAALIEDVADAYGAGFEDALAQVACVHPEMDISPLQRRSGLLMDSSHPESVYIYIYIYTLFLFMNVYESVCFKLPFLPWLLTIVSRTNIANNTVDEYSYSR